MDKTYPQKSPEITEDEKAQIVQILRQNNVSASMDTDIEDLAQRWLLKYVTGACNILPVNYSDKLLMLAASRYETTDFAPVVRWMKIGDIEQFMNNFPDEDEIYEPKRVQSFAKTQRGAEIIGGNNFSDSNVDMNTKFVVWPKAKTSKAYDIGEGIYGADEVIYKSNQKFRVLYKAQEDLGTHKLYTVYMQEE